MWRISIRTDATACDVSVLCIRLSSNAFANGGASRFAQRVQKLGGKPAQHVVWQEQQYLLLRTFGMKYKVLFVNTAP
jgi:hypothetical protein